MASCTVSGGGNDQTGEKCVPCSSMDTSHLLNNEDVDRRLQERSSIWTRQIQKIDGKEIPFLTRTFIAKNFQCGLDYINACGIIAEREGHHPNFHLTNYRQVQIDIYTHKLNGITENDVALAIMFDTEVKVDYSPKWLQEHPEAKSTAKNT